MQSQKITFGKDYNYSQQIATPQELGMSNRGTLSQLSDNVAGMINYINILSNGDSKASKQNNGPLGDSYFVDTHATCKNGDNSVPRHFYMNNKPSGNIPFLTGRTSAPVGGNRGLISGILEQASSLDPSVMIKDFGDTSTTTCGLQTFEIIDNNGKSWKETRYVSDKEIENIPKANPKLECNPNLQKNSGDECCIPPSSEDYSKYNANDKLLKCEGFTNKKDLFPYNYKYKYINIRNIHNLCFLLLILIILYKLICSRT